MAAEGVQALTQLDGQTHQQFQLLNEQRTLQQRDLESRMGAEIQHQTLYGHASGSGPAASEIISAFGGDRLNTLTPTSSRQP